MAGRRGNGEGSIYQLEDGRWRGQVTIAGKRSGAYGKTRKEVQEKLRKLLADADLGIVPSTERYTVAKFLDRWLADVVEHSRRPNTARNYRDMARLYLVPALGTVQLTKLQAPQIQKLYGDMLRQGLAPKTIKIAHGVIHCALEQAVAWNLVPRNVAALVTPPRVRRKEIKALDPEQARALLATAGGTRWAALIALAVATGMRQGELLGVRWGDLDLAAGVVRCTRQLLRDGRFDELKNDKHRRSIDLPASTVAALREHKRRQNEERLLVGPEWQDHDLIFCTHAGKPLNWRNVSRDFKGLLKRAGVPDLPFHGLRHSSATLLLAQGVHPKVVQERLGHSNISMTLDTYSHVLPRLGQEAAAKLDALLA